MVDKNMFDKQAWDRNEWIESEIVTDYFNMTLSECMKVFGFSRQVEWNKPPLNGQKISTYFRKYK
ncbi:MAG: hypothetical protein KH230_09455 [Enterocloster asparagiformis]|nr:hypothetical protein [Enterocloster asparagiformis]